MTREIEVKSILNKTKRRDPWFLDDYTLNAYSGCSFQCLFCYIKGSHYGTHAEPKVSAKVNAPELLDKQLTLRARKGQHGMIVVSSATDPYLHFEAEQGLTRELLGIIARHRFPVHLLTRSDGVLRDLDLLARINREAILPADLQGKLKHGAFITFSFSTLDDRIAGIFEPGATPPALRLQTMRTVLSEGFHSGISLMPLLPWITDTGANLDFMFSEFSRAGARYLFGSGLTLFGKEVATSRYNVFRAVEKHFPRLREKYETLLGSSDYLPAYYLKALAAKLKELGTKYSLPDTALEVRGPSELNSRGKV